MRLSLRLSLLTLLLLLLYWLLGAVGGFTVREYIYMKKRMMFGLTIIKQSDIDINSHWSLGFSFFRFLWGHILQGVVVFGFSKRQIRAKKCKTLQESQHSHNNGRTAVTYPPPMRLPRLLIGLALQVSSQVNLR